MANMTRFDPFSDIARFSPLHEFDDFFRVPRVRALWRDLPAQPEIKIDVTEDDKAYHVKADVPGVKKDDISIAIDGNKVSITAEVRKEKDERNGESELCSERYYGMQSRSFTLMHEIDQARAEARSAEGVLEITLPKKGGTPARKLAVA